jgi:hypothetical protein
MKVTGQAVQVKAGTGALTRPSQRRTTWRAGPKRGTRIPSEL